MSHHSFSKRLRRAIMMATVFWVFDKDNLKKAQALRRCNQELNLVRNLDALKIPYKLKDLVWRDPAVIEQAQHLLDEGDIAGAVRVLQRNAPLYLKYGKGVEADITDALLASQNIKLA